MIKKLERKDWEETGLLSGDHLFTEVLRDKLCDIFNALASSEWKMEGNENVLLFPLTRRIFDELIKADRSDLVSELSPDFIINESRVLTSNCINSFKDGFPPSPSIDVEAECCALVSHTLAMNLINKDK